MTTLDEGKTGHAHRLLCRKTERTVFLRLRENSREFSPEKKENSLEFS